jgi:hypothetical protein
MGRLLGGGLADALLEMAFEGAPGGGEGGGGEGAPGLAPGPPPSAELPRPAPGFDAAAARDELLRAFGP